jgi:hypothetical protein
VIEIWHHKHPTAEVFLGLLDPRFIHMNDYTHVANVATDSLEEAFALSQHFDEHTGWQYGPRVMRRLFRGSIRSTSVGDVLMREGKRYLIEVIGFKLCEDTEGV